MQRNLRMDIDEKKLIRGSDIQDLRELLEARLMDIYWLIGTGSFNSTWKLTGKEGERPISDPSLCILTRFLSKNSDYNLLPKPPEFEEVFQMINEVRPDLFENQRSPGKVSLRRFAPLFGKNFLNSSQWAGGVPPSPVVTRLFLIVIEVIKREGKEGLAKYLNAVEEEAQARGFKNLEELLNFSEWKTQSFAKEINERYGKPGKKK